MTKKVTKLCKITPVAHSTFVFTKKVTNLFRMSLSRHSSEINSFVTENKHVLLANIDFQGQKCPKNN